MITHFIILSSSWSEGTRIGLHFTDECVEEYNKAIKKIRSAYDGKIVSFSTHMLHTESDTWQSVCDLDRYFVGVRVIDSVDEFVSLIRRDRYLKGVDVARYILAKISCTHTRLEKLTYFCYAEYLCGTGSRLFTDKVYAFEHGPVIESVWEKYKDQSNQHPGDLVSTIESTPMRCRIMFAEDGIQKVCCIDKTLKKYGGFTTEELVEMTHRTGSPWSMTDRSVRFAEISDESIRAGHGAESC